MILRQNRRPPEGAISKSISLAAALVERVTQEAAREGHFNFSTVVNKALTEYFDRRDGGTEEAA